MQRSRLILFASIVITALVVSGAWYALAPTMIEPKIIEKEKPVEKIVEKENRLEPVTVILSWLPHGKYVPFYTALDKGFYTQEGIAATFIPGRGSGFSITLVNEKKADFGVADVAALIQYRAGQNVKVRSVYQLGDKVSFGVIFPKALNIKHPKDLEGKSFGEPIWSAVTKLMPVVLRINGADWNKVTYVNLDPTLVLPNLIKGTIDTGGFDLASDVSYLEEMKKAGKDPDYLLFSKWGLDIYGHAIIVHEDFIKEKPDLIRRFIAATIKGAKYSLERPEEGVAALLRFEPAQVKDIQTKSWEIAAQLLKKDPFGFTVKDKMEATIAKVQEGYKLKRTVSAEEMYTNEFLPTG